MGSGDLAALLAHEDQAGLIALARARPGKVFRYLSSRLYTTDDEEKWRAVRALGAVVSDTSVTEDHKVQDLLRRYFWSLSDESGTVPYGLPEAVGEILACRPEFQEEFLPILCSMMTHEDMVQTGPIEQGVIWALGRVGAPVASCSPDTVKALQFVAWSHADQQSREMAGSALSRIIIQDGS